MLSVRKTDPTLKQVFYDKSGGKGDLGPNSINLS